MGFCAALARRYFRYKNKVVGNEVVEEFYRGVDNPWRLREKIARKGFSWKGELSWLDWNKDPAECLSAPLRQINCGDYVELYKALYGQEGISYKVWLLERNSAWSWNHLWHYVTTFEWSGSLWLQTNNDIVKIDSEENIQGIFKVMYDRIREIEK